MYITLFIIVLIVGLLMVLLPSKAIKNLVNQNGVLVVLRLLGIIMCVVKKQNEHDNTLLDTAVSLKMGDFNTPSVNLFFKRKTAA